jgi:hypothetical protein
VPIAATRWSLFLNVTTSKPGATLSRISAIYFFVYLLLSENITYFASKFSPQTLQQKSCQTKNFSKECGVIFKIKM